MSGVNKRLRQAKLAGVVNGEGNKQRRFADEFKREAVRLTVTSGRSVERVANDLHCDVEPVRSEYEQADLPEGLSA
jgi:transposase-like protein